MNCNRYLGTTISFLVIPLLLVPMLSGCANDSEEATASHIREALLVKGAEGALNVKTARVESKPLVKDLKIPAELIPYREVAIYPKAQGFVRSILVDRGTSVKQGQTLVEIIAPEVDAHRAEEHAKWDAAQSAVAEAENKVQSLMAQAQEAESRLSVDEALLRRVTQAAQTPGAVAPYDLEQAQQKVAADKARVQGSHNMIAAARSELNAQRGRLSGAREAERSAQHMKEYLTIKAPFSGVITERNVHEGSFVNSTMSNSPMLRIQENSTLRLLVPVPESAVPSVKPGQQLSFTVPAYAHRVFNGVVQRMSHNLDRKTRSMLVEADVANRDGALEPGMYPEVRLHVVSPTPTLFVPSHAVASSEGKQVVYRVNNGAAEAVPVDCKQSMGGLIEVFGDINVGDRIAITHVHELQQGRQVNATAASDSGLTAVSPKEEH